MGKVIHWEFCKKLKLDHSTQWYVHKPVSVRENETQSSLRFGDTNRSPNPGQKTRPNDNNQKKKKKKEKKKEKRKENLPNSKLCRPR